LLESPLPLFLGPMNVTTDKPEPGIASLTIEVPAEDYDSALDGAWRRLSNRVNIPGFRRGKAPRHLVERQVGPLAIREEALRRLFAEQYDAAVREAGINPIEQPTIEPVSEEAGKPFVFKATVAVAPTAEIGDLSDLKIEPEPVTVADEQIDRVIEQMREGQAQWLPVEDRGVENGDMLIADVTFKLQPNPDEPDKEPASSERKDSEVIIGQNGYPAGFDEQVLGMKPGDTREFELTWELSGETPPEEAKEGEAESAEPEKRTRTTPFTVVAKDLKRKSLPDVDDAFAASVGTYKTVDEMREDVRRRLYASALESAREATENKALQAAVEKTSYEIAGRLIELETNALVEERRRTFAQQRIPLERYLQIMGTSEEDWRKEQREIAERQLKGRVFMDTYAEKEGIEVKPEQVLAEIERVAAQYGPQAAQARRELSSVDNLRSISRTLRRRAALEKLVTSAGGYPVDELGTSSGEAPDAGASDEDVAIQDAVEATTADAAEGASAGKSEAAAGE
jgi:trigger factor